MLHMLIRTFHWFSSPSPRSLLCYMLRGYKTNRKQRHSIFEPPPVEQDPLQLQSPMWDVFDKIHCSTWEAIEHDPRTCRENTLKILVFQTACTDKGHHKQQNEFQVRRQIQRSETHILYVHLNELEKRLQMKNELENTVRGKPFEQEPSTINI